MSLGAVLLVISVASATWATAAARAGRAAVRFRLSPFPDVPRPPLPTPVRAADAEAGAAVASLPDAIDLLLVAARAGLPAPSAIGAVAERAPPPWGAAFVAVLGRTGRGERLVDALDELVAGAGEPAHALRSVLRAAAEDGDDLVAGLDRLGADARDARRRRAEEAARRIPVRLLLPLVACSLPAFALLSIVPILAGALGALDL